MSENLLNSIEVPSYESDDFLELTLEAGAWLIYPKSSGKTIIARLEKASKNIFPQRGKGIYVSLDKTTTIYLQGDCKKGEHLEAFYTNKFSFDGALASVVSGGGSGGVSYTFNNPLSNDGNTISVLVGNEFLINEDTGELTLNLDNNEKIKSLVQDLSAMQGNIEATGVQAGNALSIASEANTKAEQAIQQSKTQILDKNADLSSMQEGIIYYVQLV